MGGITVRQKRKGRGQPWSVFIHINGTIRSTQVGDRRAAEAVASKLRRKIKAGQLNLDPPKPRKRKPKFVEYAEHYLDKYVRTACKRTTYHSYRTIIDKHLAPSWKNKRIDEITRKDIRDLLHQKQDEGLSGKTVENIKALISGIFTHAYDDEEITKHPALKLGRFIQKHDLRRNVTALTKDQVADFLGVVQEECPRYFPLFLCAFRTGMRLGELLGLAWTDIDFAGNLINIQRAYTHGAFTTPKSHKSRLVDMSDQLKRVLLEHCEGLRRRFGGQLPECEVPGSAPVQLVFPNEKGGPLCADNFRKRVFHKLWEMPKEKANREVKAKDAEEAQEDPLPSPMERVGIPRFRFHDARHSFASLLLAQGESLHYVKEQMGHASIQITVDIYGHLVPGSNRRAVNALDDPAEPRLRVVGANAG